jgi:predicted TIM-barrel fold metal-dependent hydrolase
MRHSQPGLEPTARDGAPADGHGIRRREFIAGAAAWMLLPPMTAAERARAAPFIDTGTLAQRADRDPAAAAPFVIDAQTHVWWREGGPRSLTPSGEHFLTALAGSRAKVLGKPVPIADMGRMMFIEDMFLHSETDIAFLNSFGMRGAFDGVDLFPPREAAFIRSMAPARIRVLGVVDPPDGQSAVDSLIYQCETLKIDGLKLYPPGPVATGWRMDDEKNTYPLYEVLRKHKVRNVCVHKGLPGLFLEEYCHTADLARAAADFPDLNFIAFHCSYPFEAELAEHARRAKVKNIYAEMGGLAPLMFRDPPRYAQMLGTVLSGLGSDHVLWGTDTPVAGPPHWQIQAFLAFQFPPEVAATRGYPELTPAVKRQILGENAARLYQIDLPAARRAVQSDLLYRLRTDGNPLPLEVDPSSWKAG